MQNEMPFSLIVWDNIDNLPFPMEVKELLGVVNWDEYEWHATGLPCPFAKYSMVGGNKLYLAELPDGTIKIEEDSDFTGKILLAGYFVNQSDNEGNNYFVNFIVTILNGVVQNVTLEKVTKQPVKEYKKAMKEFNDSIRRVMTISNSWWFKTLYRPWFLCIRSIAYALILVINLIKTSIIYIVSKITPM